MKTKREALSNLRGVASGNLGSLYLSGHLSKDEVTKRENYIQHLTDALEELIKYDEPMKVEIHQNSPIEKSVYCPSCSNEVTPTFGMPHCPHCGQKLDWSDAK
jgi:hypothetical protein